MTEDFSIPVLFCFLPDKRKETYQRVFRKVKEWLPDLNSEDSKLKRFVCDYEKGLISAVKSEFDDAGIKIDGCFFHYTQCLSRHLPDYDKDLELYHTDLDFQIQFKMFTSLAHVPVEQVERIHELMMENCITFPELRAFNDRYFQKTFIRGENGNPPLFPIKDWNTSDR